MGNGKHSDDELNEEDGPEQELIELGNRAKLLNRIQRIDKEIDRTLDKLMDEEDWLGFVYRVDGKRSPFWWELYKKVKDLRKRVDQLEKLREKAREEIRKAPIPKPVIEPDPSMPEPGTPTDGGVFV